MKTASACTVFALCSTATAFVQPSSFAGARLAPAAVARTQLNMATSVEDLKALKEELATLMDKTNCAPIMVRLAWHDAGTYDDSIGVEKWPKCGGANGSIRFDPEINHGANAGLSDAFKLLKSIKAKYENVGWADLLQLASATAIEYAGGPKIPMKYGRVDAAGPDDCSREGNLPAGGSPFPKNASPEEHIREVFYRMGFDDKGIVALSGAHTLGRASKDRSGFGKESTKYTDGSTPARADGKPGIGRKGGMSWTKQWLKFDNSYFSAVPEDDEDLLKLETDNVLFTDEKFRPYSLEYKKDEAKFFADYAAAHKQLSEQGSKFDPPEGITI